MVVIPIHDMVILPDVTFYFKKDFFRSLHIESVTEGEDVLFLMMRGDKERSSLSEEDVFPYGVSGHIGESDEDSIAVHTDARVRIEYLTASDGLLEAGAALAPEASDMDEKEQEALFEQVRKQLLQFVRKFPWGLWARGFILQWKNLNEAACTISGYLSLTPEDKYDLLAADSLRLRAERIRDALQEFMDIADLSAEAENEQKEKHERIYREDTIRKQIEYLQKQLDAMHPENVTDIRRFETKLAESGMNETARREAEKVLNRMKQEGKDSHEYGLLYDYLDFVTGLSWKKEEAAQIDLEEAERILDKDHYGLKKVKSRIIQQLAVMSLNHRQSGSILLFVGAPGTGKTSIGQSIAEALHRPYVRVSLGGIRDEAEIRGHRRTYVGAMPGRIMEGIKRSGKSNPVVVLDEVDKLSRDFHGDPASALLEVLDPEQNHTFTDHYMNVPYDLSDVLFVCTANSAESIPEPLLNRMEVIRFPGYTAIEKYQIARRHLLPKAMEKTGLKSQMLKVTDETIRAVISDYTMESGVRGLKKQLETLCRFAAVKLVKGERKSLSVSPRRLPEFLDCKPIRRESVLEEKRPGVVTGLAWTQAGGDILFIETLLTEGEGKVKITGQLGDVMKESAGIAVSLVKSLYPEQAQALKDHDLHIHVPAGAVPKDGPSAGVTLTTALVSLLTGTPVGSQLAMTGEMSLRGRVMPIGGLNEKLMAAQRAGITTVLIPEENMDDLDEVADEVKQKLTIVPVRNVKELLAAAGLS